MSSRFAGQGEGVYTRLGGGGIHKIRGWGYARVYTEWVAAFESMYQSGILDCCAMAAVCARSSLV